MTATSVVLEKENKKTVTVPLTRLDATSQEIAKDAYPFFLVETKMREIIQKLTTDDAAADARERIAFHKSLIEKANAELRRYRLKTRYRIISASEVTKPKVTSSKIGEFSVRFTHLYTFDVPTDSWQGVARPNSGYWKGRSFKAEEYDRKDIIVGKSIVEVTAIPQLLPHVGGVFTWSGVGKHTNPDVRGPIVVQVGLEMMKEAKTRIFTPAE
ncbi:MAG: hypothetical protein IH991_02845 [Planctomycetes bacterium]|nr:hypothetical protein [Planctomycetota bacterium]